MEKTYKLTEQGLLDLQNELEKLKTVDRKRNLDALKEARAQGDLSENADYDAARDEQAQIEARIKEIEGILNIHPEMADRLGFLQTRSFWPVYPAVFARKGVSFEKPKDLDGKRVAFADQTHLPEKLAREYGRCATCVKVEDSLEGLRLLESGDVDFYLGVYNIKGYDLRKDYLSGRSRPGTLILTCDPVFREKLWSLYGGNLEPVRVEEPCVMWKVKESPDQEK